MKQNLIIAALLLGTFACDGAGINPPAPQKPGDNNNQPPATVTSKAVVYVGETFGCVTRNFFYDIKDGGKVSEQDAAVLYGDEGMNGIRIPIYGNVKDGKVVGHPSAGVVESADYQKVLSSVNAARQYCPDLMVFASKKLSGKTSFADWLKTDGELDNGKYCGMIIDFLKYMKANDIEVDVLGIDNEMNFNEGNIVPSKYIAIVNELRTRIEAEGLKMPLFIGPERYNPQKFAAGNWFYDFLSKDGDCGTMDIYGTHYYPRHHFFSMNRNLRNEVEAAASKGMPFWATEPHWDNEELAKADPLGHARMAICALWDQTDLGLDAFMWWGYPVEVTDLRSALMHKISGVVYGSRPIRIEDHDGEATMGTRDYSGKWTDARQKPNNDEVFDNRLHSRAFIRENGEVNVFFINVKYKSDLGSSSGKSYKNYLVELDGAEIDGDIKMRQWTDDSPYTGAAKTIKPSSSASFTADFPSRSITRLTFRVK